MFINIYVLFTKSSRALNYSILHAENFLNQRRHIYLYSHRFEQFRFFSTRTIIILTCIFSLNALTFRSYSRIRSTNFEKINIDEYEGVSHAFLTPEHLDTNARVTNIDAHTYIIFDTFSFTLLAHFETAQRLLLYSLQVKLSYR